MERRGSSDKQLSAYTHISCTILDFTVKNILSKEASERGKKRKCHFSKCMQEQAELTEPLRRVNSLQRDKSAADDKVVVMTTQTASSS